MKKFLLAVITLFLFCSPAMLFAQAPVDTANITDIDTSGQKDLLDVANHFFKFKKRKYPKDDKQLYFSILPVSSSVPGGKALVTSTTAGFYLGPRRTTYLSSVTFAPYLNFAGRYGLPIHSSIWLKDNLYNVQGDIRFLVYPEYTWGLGGGQNEQDRITVDYKYIRFYQTLLKRISPAFYAGIGYNLDYYLDIHSGQPPTTVQGFTGYPYGNAENSNSFSSGLNFDLLYDTRQNSLNPIPGVYGNLIYRHDARVLGSDNNAQSVYLDLRKYLSLSGNAPGKNQLAFWFYYWTTLSNGTPFLNLPAIGMDPYQRSGRGIEQNRYRGNELLYFETEYRRDITKNGLLGFVLFANFNSATQNNSREFSYINPAGGGGLRVKFNKKSNTNIGLDYGVSKGYHTLIFSLGEAF